MIHPATDSLNPRDLIAIWRYERGEIWALLGVWTLIWTSDLVATALVVLVGATVELLIAELLLIDDVLSKRSRNNDTVVDSWIIPSARIEKPHPAGEGA